MSFEIIKDDRDKGNKVVPITSITVVKGDLVELVAGTTTWALVTSSSNHFTRKAIAQEAATTSATELLVLELDGTETVKVETANNSAEADRGDRMAATDANTVNNSGTDVTAQAAVFVQDGEVGAVGDKRIIGQVLVGSGVDPDAT